MVYKYYYFPVRGRGEAIRLLLEDNGIAYEEINVAPSWEVWVKEWKPKMPFGQAPLFVDGDVELVQSNTILRYLGRKHDMYGSGPVEQARMDMINDHIEDVRVEYVRLIYQNYEAGKADYVKGISRKLTPVENYMKTWGNGFIGKKISFVDYNLFDLLDIHQLLSPGCLDDLPTLKQFYERILNRPGVQRYRQSEPFKTRTVNYNGKQ